MGTARPPSSALDELLVIECQLGNVEAFRALVRRWHGPFVLRAQHFTRDREAALDVAQESWIGVARGLRGLRDPGRFPAWAMRIVANKARDWIRRERSRRAVAADTTQEVNHAAATDGRVERLREGLDGLEAGQRDLLRRHYLEGRSVNEIALELGIPEGTVKSRLSNARHHLRQCLEEDR